MVEMLNILLVECFGGDFLCFFFSTAEGYRAIYSTNGGYTHGWYLDGLSSTWDHMYVTWQSFSWVPKLVENTHIFGESGLNNILQFQLVSFIMLGNSRRPIQIMQNPSIILRDLEFGCLGS